VSDNLNSETINIEVKIGFVPSKEDLHQLYSANEWSSANKLEQLHLAMQHSDSLVVAYHDNQLVGLANAISDGYLVVYFPHMLIHPDYQRKGIGSRLMDVLLDKYKDFHQKMIVADDQAIEFYKSKGFRLANNTSSMWIYEGGDH
jgi:GNAT superfamily N-acetyltransferase